MNLLLYCFILHRIARKFIHKDMLKYIYAALLVFISLQAKTQIDSINSISPADSISRDNNITASTLIRQAASESVTDSLKKVILLEQLQTLQKNDSKQKVLIEKQIKQMERDDSTRLVALRKRIDSLKLHAHASPVVLGNDTTCLIYMHVGSFTPDERAASISAQLLKTAKVFSVQHDSLYIQENDHSSDIVFNDRVIMGVTDMDALWQNTNRKTLAQVYRQQFRNSIEKYQKDVSFINILKRIGLCILVILLQCLLIKGVNYFFRKMVDSRIKAKKDEWFTGIRIRTYEVLDSGKQVNILLFLSKITRYFVNLLQLYITIPILFSIFPPTQRLAETLFGWVLTPISYILKSFVNYLPNLFMIIIIVIITRYVVRFARYITKEIECERLTIPGFYPDWAKATFNLLRLFLYAFMLVMIFPLLPSSDTEIFKGVSVFIGVIFSLGSSSIIANIVAGMVITYMRPFKKGDRIKIGDLTGDVVEKSPFVTRIKTHKNEIITVPNSSILSSSVVNYSSSASENGLILHTTVTIGYDAPWREVHAVLIKAAQKTAHLLNEPQPFVLQTALNDFYVSYELCAYTKDAELQTAIYSELHQNIQDCFNEAGIEIMSPHYRAVRDGNQSTIPNTQK